MAKVSKQKKREIERAKWVEQLPKDSATALAAYSRNSYSYIDNQSNNKAFIQAQAYYVSAGWKAKSKRKGYVRGCDLQQGKLYTIGAVYGIEDEIKSDSQLSRWKEHFSIYKIMGFYLFDKNSVDLYLAENQKTLNDFFFCGRSFNGSYEHQHSAFYKNYQPHSIVSVLPLGAAMNFSYANSVEWTSDMSKVCVLEALVAVKEGEAISLKHCYFSPENIKDILMFKRVEQGVENNV